MRTIDADKLYPDCMTKNGTLAISQSQIANAPTLKFSLLPADESKDEAYMRGYNHGFTEGILKAPRPKGEWIKVKEERMSVDTVTIYKCSKCERVIATFPSKLAEYYPFCHCGADMRKGGKEC